MRTNKNRAIFLFPLLLMVFGCGEKNEEHAFIARVNNEFLDSTEVENELSSLKNKSQFKDEFIRDWVKREVLFLEAKKSGLLGGDEYKKIIADSKKELAASLLLKNVSAKFTIKADESDLREFYDLHKQEFRIPADAFIMNRVTFRDKERAIKFRTTVLDSGWHKAVAMFTADSTVIKIETEKFIYYYEVYPVTLIRYMKYLDPSETSVVFESEPSMFSIVQVKNKFKKGDIPPFEKIRNEVKNKYVMIARTDSLENYIEDLMPHYNIEIKKD
ncbi:MAG: peptidyl-prolyl cis-trans isomerase [Chlorobi bacterium]|nr:peptidyl-prolyl cis-trans isomerase [Chlorobiota bacterium]